MKKPKLLIALFIAVGFSAATVTAQTERGSNCETWHLEGAFFDDCLGETLTGDLVYQVFWLAQDGREWGKVQQKYDGVLIGDLTGATYLINEVDQDHWVTNQNAGNWYYNGHWNIIRVGEGVVGIAHVLVRGTATDSTWEKKEGNWASWVELTRYECK